MHSLSSLRSTRGFTLIELMIVVVIATILLAIAVPSYMQQIRQSRRTEAKTALLDLAGREERFFATNGVNYSQIPSDLGYTALGAALPVGSGYYGLSVCTPAAAGCGGTVNPPGTWALPAAPNYLVIATPIAGQSQANDTQCASFFVDSTGKQMAVDNTGADNSAYCWAN
ncbi:MAG TPA: type IV pilin protein [Steroidobacteraceae bacterium]|nr:type IV pilin protein [Steroidobacteraceae bacterium]